MKKFYTILLGVAVSLAAVSCLEEKQEPYTPGEPEAENCFGVYFPAQEASGYHIYSPSMDTKVDITVARTNTNGEITVPVEATFSEDVFTATDIKFADGQAETTFTVSFPTIEQGKTYSASFIIKDKNYASLYSSNPIAFDFSVMQVEMLDWLNPVTKEKAVVHWTQSWWGETVDTYIKYYEVNGVKTCFTVTIPDSHVASAPYEAYGFFGCHENEGEGEWTLVMYPEKSDGNSFIRIPLVNTGYHHSSYDADIYALDYFYWNASDPNDEAEFLSYAASNADVVSYYDGNGGWYLSIRSYYMFGVGGWNPGAYDIVGIMEGYTRVDYSLSIAQTAVPSNGKVPVKFTLGPDVAKVVYEFKEGELSKINTEKAMSELKADSANAITEAGTYEFELPKTGVYTLVAASVDAKGEIHETANTIVTYTAAADVDEYATVINGGIGSAEKYIPQGVNTDNSLEIYLYGENIVDAKIGLFSLLDLVGDYDGCVNALTASESVSAEVLDAINGDGYVDVATGLLPGTEYYMMVYASNAFTETVELYGSATTTGDPLPIYQTFTGDDYYADGELENAAAWCGKWNYYAIDVYGSTGLREYLGKVDISASTTPTEGPDGNGYYDEYVLVDGLFPNAVVDGPAYGYETGTCVLEMDVYAGAMYSFAKTTFDEVCTIHTYTKSGNTWYSGVSYYSGFLPVMDGYYAFVDLAGSDYDFTGLRVVQSYVWDAFIDLLLVDPAKDDNGIAPASINAAVQRARQIVKDTAKEFDNAVMSPKGRAAAIAESYKEKMKGVAMYNNFAGIHGERPVKSVPVKSVNYLGNTSVKGFNMPIEK